VGIGVSLLSSSFPLFLASSAIGMLSIYLGSRKFDKKPANSQEFTIDLNQFQGWLNTWAQLTL
jgi:hypothetical protein